MVARNVFDNEYHYIRGTAPNQFDVANAENLSLAGYRGAPGAWDINRYGAHGASDTPVVTSAKVVNGTLYIFYVAGTPLSAFVAVPTAKLGLGVLARKVI